MNPSTPSARTPRGGATGARTPRGGATGARGPRGHSAGARGSWPLRDRPALLWLVLAALVALIHQWVPDATWLMVHLVLLGALTHSIFVWSTHFTQALLKTPDSLDTRANQNRRLALLLVGTALVLVGVPSTVWALVVLGAGLVSAAVLWHAAMLWRRLRRALPGRFRITVRYYLLAAACLPVGAGLGASLALGLSQPWHERLLVAHTMVNLLGWVGLTVTGTLITLWPTMLRTPMDQRAEALARQALPVLVTALVLVVGGGLAGLSWLGLAGLSLYGGGLLWWARALWRPARTRPPREFATASVGCALLWLLVGLAWAGVLIARQELSFAVGAFSAVFVVGFAAQLLTGALSYLLPSVLGGGPAVVRTGQAWFNKVAALRLVIINVGLLLCVLPVPSLVRVIVSVLVLGALAGFIPLMVVGLRAAVHARRTAAAQAGDPPGQVPPRPARVERPPSALTWAQGVAALAALLVAVTVGVGLDPQAAGLPAAGGQPQAQVAPTGETTRVEVVAAGMSYSPSSITVPAGDRLVIELVNEDPSTTHDLALGGEQTPRLAHGERAELVIDVVSGPLEGWCTIVGHRQMGMTFQVHTTGEGAHAGPSTDATGLTADEHSQHGTGGGPHHDGTGPAAGPLLGAAELDGPVLEPVDPALPPAADETVHTLTLRAEEVPLEVAPGIWQHRWTFNGQVPGPTLRGKVGDVFDITLVNDGTLGHSIDFHAGALAPDEPMRTIAPGESLTYRFTATRAGIWMYHCSTMPMSAHIAAGMTGAVIIDPPEGLAPVDHEYVLVQSEVYLSSAATEPGSATEVDVDKVLAEEPDLVVFNGIANQYDEHRLEVSVGDRVRFWVLAAGPNRPSSFHVVGGQFDTVYHEGAYHLGGPDGPAVGSGSQVLGLHPAQGGFVELEVPEAGNYPIVSHLMVDAERGAHGLLHATE